MLQKCLTTTKYTFLNVHFTDCSMPVPNDTPLFCPVCDYQNRLQGKYPYISRKNAYRAIFQRATCLKASSSQFPQSSVGLSERCLSLTLLKGNWKWLELLKNQWENCRVCIPIKREAKSERF